LPFLITSGSAAASAPGSAAGAASAAGATSSARNATACRAKWAAIVKYIKAHILPGIETVTPTIVMALIDDSRGKSVPFLA